MTEKEIKAIEHVGGILYEKFQSDLKIIAEKVDSSEERLTLKIDRSEKRVCDRLELVEMAIRRINKRIDKTDQNCQGELIN